MAKVLAKKCHFHKVAQTSPNIWATCEVNLCTGSFKKVTPGHTVCNFKQLLTLAGRKVRTYVPACRKRIFEDQFFSSKRDKHITLIGI